MIPAPYHGTDFPPKKNVRGILSAECSRQFNEIYRRLEISNKNQLRLFEVKGVLLEEEEEEEERSGRTKRDKRSLYEVRDTNG